MSKQLAVYPEMPIGELGKVLAESGFFADAKNESQAIVKVLAGRELGFGPIASMTGIYIVKGKPTLSANLMSAAVKRDEQYNYRVAQLTDSICELVFFEDGQEIGRSTFTKEDAQKAGTQNMSKFPRNMLFARALSNGVKWHCPDVMSGAPVYTPDELGAEVDGETGEIVVGSYEVVKPLPEKPTTSSTPLATNATIGAAIIAAKLTENTFSYAGTVKKSNLPVDASLERVTEWFDLYRDERTYGADSDEAALFANAATYRTESGKILGQLSTDELAGMIDKINALPQPVSGLMATIKGHCEILVDRLVAESIEVA